jgi:hypothetical protein
LKIRARFHGLLTEWVTAEVVDFDLCPEPTYADLLKDIGSRFSEDMPPQLWDRENNSFNKSILAVGDGRDLAMDSPLKPNEEITFYLMLAGG